MKLKFYLTALLAFLASGAVCALTPKAPDFAFPDRVITRADSTLDIALKKHDSRAVIRALIDYSLARNEISPSYLPLAALRVDSIAAIERNVPARSLLRLLEATMYNTLYRSLRWVADSREVPLDPLPADCMEWSGEQFRSVISRLLAEATSPTKKLYSSRLSDWEGIIVTTPDTYLLYPTLYDFIAYRAIDIYESMVTDQGIIPDKYFTPERFLDPLPDSLFISPAIRSQISLCHDLIRLHAKNPGPRIKAEIRIINILKKLIGYHVYGRVASASDKILMSIYRANESTQWSGLALVYAYPAADSIVPVLRNFIDRYPDFVYTNFLKNKLAEYLQPEILFNLPDNFPPNTEVNAYEFELTNVRTLSLRFHNEETGRDVVRTMSYDRELPYKSSEDFSLTLPEPGRYSIYVTLNDEPESLYRTTLDCSAIGAFPVDIASDGWVYAVNPKTGVPLKDIEVTYNDTNKSTYSLGKTDAEGCISIPLRKDGDKIILSDGSSKTVINYSNRSSYDEDGFEDEDDYNVELAGNIFTDLPLYHPGDTIRWAFIGIKADKKQRTTTVIPDHKFIVKTFDANNKEIHRDTVISDAYGRGEALSPIPANAFSGKFRLVLEDTRGKVYTTKYITVNDYKLPTFSVQAVDIRRSNNPDSTVAITFAAKTFSGFPVIGAKIEASITQGIFSRYTESKKLWTKSSETDSEGRATFVIPQQVFDEYSTFGPTYSIMSYVTSPAGESAECSTTFKIGKPYTITTYYTTNRINIDRYPSIAAGVLDANLKNVDIPLQACLWKGDSLVAELPVGEPLPSTIENGVYRLVIKPLDAALADSVELDPFTIYRASGPCPFSSFTIPDTYTLAYEKNQKLIFANPYPDNHILVIESVDGKPTSRYWIQPGEGMHTLDINIPDGSKAVIVNMVTYYDYDIQAKFTRFENMMDKKSITITAETFRDHVVPDTEEHLTLSVKISDDKPVPAAMILAMNSTSISKLQSYGLYMDLPNFPNYQYDFCSEYNSSANSLWVRKDGSITKLKTNTILSPAFDLYGLSFSNNSFTRRRTATNYLSAAGSPVKSTTSFSDVDEDEIIVEESFQMKTYAASVGSSSEVLCEVKSVRGISTDGGSETGASGDTDSQALPDDFKYRPTEIPLAFFEPMLTTDADGVLHYTYTVPSANTSWEFNALAYTTDLLDANLHRTVVASRPLMVQSNLPRFLRYGDDATLKATVMNLSDTAISAVTTVTILDPETMAPIATHTYTDSVSARGCATVSTRYTVPDAPGQAVIYRVKTSAGAYTDGEQNLIPLLPATQPVITSTPFFIPASVDEASVDLPAAPAGSSATLYLYDNPIWEVVTALPSLYDGQATTSPGAATKLYTAAVARKLMRTYPAISRGLDEWLHSDRADSTLVSMLERNDDLKQLTLNATPWVQAAMSASERLDRLALILDDSNTRADIFDAVKRLTELACPDGGLKWSPGDRGSSRWATRYVLADVIDLKIRDCVPNDNRLKTLVKNAVGYFDSIARADYAKYGLKASYTDYVWLRTMLREYAPDPIPEYDTILHHTVSTILSDWKDGIVLYKGLEALILYYNSYPAVAREIIASMISYSMHSPDKGRWWSDMDPGLVAFLLNIIQQIDPTRQEAIDGIAQWLILAKTSMDWGNSNATAACVNALLGAIPADKAATARTAVTLNGSTVVSDTPQLPGMTVSDISDRLRSAGNTLAISKPTGLPAMGSVITRSVMAMDSIVPHDNPSVTIRKRINVVTPTGVAAADTLRIGDRIRVQLIITVKDNLDYLTVVDRNGACFEPVEQLSGYRWQDGLGFYREVTDTENHMFIYSVTPGTYIVDYEMYVTMAGRYSSGVATIQSQINPAIDANSGGRYIIVNP